MHKNFGEWYRQVSAIGALAVVVGAVAWKVFQTPPKDEKKLKLVYVGSGWTWPRPDRFPNIKSFGDALGTLGYGYAVFRDELKNP